MGALDSNRRDFIKTAGAGAAALAVPGCSKILKPKPAQTAIPRWRGFNLQYFYKVGRGIKTPNEDHFRWISDWGFDIVRMPMAYRTWLQKKVLARELIEIEDAYQIDESTLELIDMAVDFGQKHDVHVSLNFHHAPGYCIHEGTLEPFSLWKDQSAIDAFCFHWEMFAKRYRGIPPSQISYNLVNEAPRPSEDMTRDEYYRAMAAATKVIRAVDPDNLIIADGLAAGNLVAPKLIPLGIGQSVHGYAPGVMSHYKAPWSRSGMAATEAKWPGIVDQNGVVWDRKRLEEHYAPWEDLCRQGIGVHMGECSGYNMAPHDVFLAWFRDVLDIITEMGIGYALWDFIAESNFGILDTERADVNYEDWYGHKLDRKMLTMLQEF